MPPQPEWFAGRDAVRRFLASILPAEAREFRCVPLAANGGLAAAIYARPMTRDVEYEAAAINVVAVRGGLIAEMTRFASPKLFPLFGLPAHLASSQPHGTTAYAGSWDQGGESKRPAVRVPRIDHGVDRFFTAPQRREGGPGHPCWRGRPERRTARGQRRRERGWGRVLLAGAVGGGSAASSAGLSLGRYDSPSMTKS